MFVLLSLNVAYAEVEKYRFTKATPTYQLEFPRDHGEHKNFRLEWWYLTGNLSSEKFGALGIQWTLFKNELIPQKEKDPLGFKAFWMAHSAVTTKEHHYFEERFARLGMGLAGVTTSPFKAWIDNWVLKGSKSLDSLILESKGKNFSYQLELNTEFDPILQGNNGYSLKSDTGNSSHYYSQPFYKVTGWVEIDEIKDQVNGFGWLDREWSSDLLDEKQVGWDWFSIHLKNGDKIMLFQVRQENGDNFVSGNWLNKVGTKQEILPEQIQINVEKTKPFEGSQIPIRWHIFLPGKDLNLTIEPINEDSFMKTLVPYWEGPVKVFGSHEGVGYLEMTGYTN